MKEQKEDVMPDQRHACWTFYSNSKWNRFFQLNEAELRCHKGRNFLLEAATENVMKQVLVETIACMEKEIAQEEWEMAVVDYAEPE